MYDIVIDVLNMIAGGGAIVYGSLQWFKYRERNGWLWCATGSFVIFTICFSYITKYLISGTDEVQVIFWWARQLFEVLGMAAWLALGFWLYVLRR